MHFTAVIGHAHLKMGVIASQPAGKEEENQ
jgi:hypothetical protein